MKDRTKKFALGTIFAAVAGYVAGILTAPKSGKETRQDIQEKAGELKSEAEKNLKKMHADLSELLESVKKNSRTLEGALKTKANQAIAVAQNARVKVGEVLSSLHEGVADDKELKSALKEANDALKHLKKYVDDYQKTVKKAAKK